MRTLLQERCTRYWKYKFHRFLKTIPSLQEIYLSERISILRKNVAEFLSKKTIICKVLRSIMEPRNVPSDFPNFCHIVPLQEWTEYYIVISYLSRCGKGSMVFLGTALIKMPIGKHFTLQFQIYVIDHDISIIFGLEHPPSLQCSSNEVDLTFTHHPSGTTVPIKYRQYSASSGDHLYLNWHELEVLHTMEELKSYIQHMDTLPKIHFFDKRPSLLQIISRYFVHNLVSFQEVHLLILITHSLYVKETTV